jgi:hypothetical protein
MTAPNSPQADFPLSATLLLPSEDAPELTADQVEAKLRERIPGVVVDRERGDRHVAEGLQRLIEMGTPEIIFRGHRSLFGRTLYVEFPIEGHSGTTLCGYTSGFSRYDGCIGLDCQPFDVDAIKAGALRFAERMDLALTLGFGDIEEINLELWPERFSPEEVLARRIPEAGLDEFRLRELSHDLEEVAAACRQWIERHPEQRIRDAWLCRRGTPEESVPRLVERLRSIGFVRRCLAATPIGGYRDRVILEYPDWTGLLSLPGIPGTVFA